MAQQIGGISFSELWETLTAFAQHLGQRLTGLNDKLGSMEKNLGEDDYKDPPLALDSIANPISQFN